METVDAAGVVCLEYLTDLVIAEIKNDSPDVAKISTALGVVEAALTAKNEAERCWPADLPQRVDDCMRAFQSFMASCAAATASVTPNAPADVAAGQEEASAAQSALATRAKVKLIADAVWSKLTGSFSKDILHAQHVYNFSKLLLPDTITSPKRHLDCAGVTTTTYAVCRLLRIPVHMQVSEDHCFLTLHPQGGREGSIEVTTDTPAKRGLPAAAELWDAWLYCGGHSVVCSPQQVVAATVVSITPQISPGRKSSNCERLQALQFKLLTALREHAPAALYPAAVAALADLHAIAEEEAVEAALEKGDAAAMDAALERREGDAQALFEEAIALAAAEAGDGVGWQWYNYSYIVGFLCERAELLEQCAAAAAPASERQARLRAAAEAAFREALSWAAKGSAVLARYAFRPEDEELYKDVGESVLEACCDGLAVLATRTGCLGGQKALQDASLLQPLFTLWDGCCVLFSGRPKPAAWLTRVLKVAKLFTPEARAEAAAAAEARSGAMQKARPMWAALKPALLRPHFEAAEVGDGAERASKRARG